MKDNAKRNETGQKEFWTEFSEKYHKDFYTDVEEYPSLVLRHNYILDMLDKKNKRVLDIGCGPGEMMIDLMSRGYEVVGVDIAEGMLAVAKENIQKRLPTKKFTLKLGDIERLDFEDKEFDYVICAGVIEYLETDAKAISELNRVLKVGGRILISVRNRFCPARVLDTIMDPVKNSSVGRSFITGVKRKIVGSMEAETRFTPYRKHNPWGFDRVLRKHGFVKKDFRFFHFYPFFAPLDKLLPSAFIRLGLKMERLSATRLGWFGSGYIVKAEKVKDIK